MTGQAVDLLISPASVDDCKVLEIATFPREKIKIVSIEVQSLLDSGAGKSLIRKYFLRNYAVI
jgi:hypothetical protein